MAKLYKVEIGTVTTLVKAKGPSSARKAALKAAGITVTKATPDELYTLGASGCKLVDATASIEDNEDE